ncbi:50S ribosomal protein L15 [Methyloligella halotolerans]|uniref:Large ribosomal subunit protein uL15 n=1 Tax=Methyloligella halotolerans TaxID=1177755 RepID=A0A1E2S1M5_9HYPH|nr:50S ribosomal protein L15 [Methyloligella halotolerans]
MRLNELKDRPGSTHSKKRVGRGPGSGLAKTSGHGMKGQKARSGVAIKGFEGGQMPLDRRLPKRGFNNIFAKHYNEVNLGRVQAAIDSGRLDGKKTVDAAALKDAGLIRREHDGVRLLGTGEIKAKVSFEVAGASQAAVKAVEAAGGSVTVTASDEAKTEKKSAKAPAKKTASKGKAEAKADDAASDGGEAKADEAGSSQSKANKED